MILPNNWLIECTACCELNSAREKVIFVFINFIFLLFICINCVCSFLFRPVFITYFFLRAFWANLADILRYSIMADILKLPFSINFLLFTTRRLHFYCETICVFVKRDTVLCIPTMYLAWNFMLVTCEKKTRKNYGSRNGVKCLPKYCLSKAKVWIISHNWELITFPFS